MLRFAITAGCLLWASTSLAQFTQNNSGGSTGYGAFGSRTIGGGINAGSSGFSSGSTSSTGSSGLGSSGYGNSTLGGNSMGGSSMGGGSQLGGSPTQGFQLGSSLSSAQQRSTAGFIGADNSDAGNLRSFQGMQQNQMGLNSLQNAFSQFSRQNQQRNQQNMNQNRNSQNQKQLRVAISADIPLKSAATSSTALGRQFETRLKKIPGLEKRNTIAVSMSGRTAVLTGSVASERDRKLAEGLALLEPGISAVQNELVVAEAASTGEELPAPAR